MCVSVPCVIVFEGAGILHAFVRHQQKASRLKAVRTKLSLQVDFYTFDTTINDWKRQASSGVVQACTSDYFHGPGSIQNVGKSVVMSVLGRSSQTPSILASVC